MPVLPDWYCCISVALDAEEDEAWSQQFNAYISAGGDPKKFPKRPKRYIQPRQEQKNPLDVIMGAVGKAGMIPSARGSVTEYAKLRGLQKVMQLPDGTFVNEDGNTIEPTAGSVFVPSN